MPSDLLSKVCGLYRARTTRGPEIQVRATLFLFHSFQDRPHDAADHAALD